MADHSSSSLDVVGDQVQRSHSAYARRWTLLDTYRVGYPVPRRCLEGKAMSRPGLEREAMSDSGIGFLKRQMEYSEERCAKCKHYVEADCSGAAGASGEHCTLNPAISVPVSGQFGRCRFYSHKDRTEK